MTTGTSGWVRIAHRDRVVWLFQADREVWLQRLGTDVSVEAFDPNWCELIGRVTDAVTDPGRRSFTAVTAAARPVRGPGGRTAVFPSPLDAAAGLADAALAAPDPTAAPPPLRGSE